LVIFWYARLIGDIIYVARCSQRQATPKIQIIGFD